jgi:hypothetical protein
MEFKIRAQFLHETAINYQTNIKQTNNNNKYQTNNKQKISTNNYAKSDVNECNGGRYEKQQVKRVS